MYTFDDLVVDSQDIIGDFISEIEMKLKYTKKTVKRKALERELMFWKADLLIAGKRDNGKMIKFYERYPHFI